MVEILSNTDVNLVCSKCNYLLSVFPIRSYENRTRFICGRCEDEVNSQREILYESLARYVPFSCRYEKNGCKESYVPQNISEHENSCFYRSYKCYMCTWEGPYTDVYEHYTSSHKEHHFSKEYDLCLDLGLNIKKDCLFLNDNFLYDVKINYDVSTNEVKLWIADHDVRRTAGKRTFGATFSEYFTGHVLFRTPHQWTVLHDRNHFGDNNFTTGLVLGPITSHLTNTMKIWMKLDFFDVEEAKKSKVCSLSEVKDVRNKRILQTLQCPVCFDYMRPWIMMCLNGHSFCKTCKDVITACPICRSSTINIRNYALEETTVCLDYPCSYTENGCNLILPMKEMQIHVENCAFKKFTCPITGCQWSDNVSEFKEHLMINHSDVLQRNPLQTSIRKHIENKFFICYNSVFKLVSNKLNSDFLWSVQVVWSEDKYTNFMFEIDIDGGRNGDRILVRKTCTPLLQETLNRNYPPLQINENSLQKLISRTTVNYTVRILKIAHVGDE